MNLISLLIIVIHIIFIIYVIIGPHLHLFIDNNFFKVYKKNKILKIMYHIMYITVSINLILHWKLNNDACFLTFMECYLRGVESNQSFIGRIISPIYNITDTQILNLSYFILIINNIANLYYIF